MNFIEAVQLGFKKSFDFKTRSSRAEFWYLMLFILISTILMAVLDYIIFKTPPEENGILGGIFTLVTFIPGIAVTTRRLHDVDRSGWWQLITITVVGTIPLLYWTYQKGDEGTNRYGYNPYDARS